MHARLILATLLLMCPGALAQSDPGSLPAQDRHEGLLVAADPYQDAARTKVKFGKADPIDAGILPIDVYFRNDTDQPMHIDLHKVRLEIAPPGEPRQRLAALSVKEVAGEIAHPGGTPNPEPPRHGVPRPIPMPSHDKKQDKLTDDLRPLAFDADVIPPHATIHGFFFFDVGHDFHLVELATFYVPEVKLIPTNQALMYFEVPLRATSRH